MPIKIQAFQTADDRVFVVEQDAIDHERNVLLKSTLLAVLTSAASSVGLLKTDPGGPMGVSPPDVLEKLASELAGNPAALEELAKTLTLSGIGAPKVQQSRASRGSRKPSAEGAKNAADNAAAAREREQASAEPEPPADPSTVVGAVKGAAPDPAEGSEPTGMPGDSYAAPGDDALENLANLAKVASISEDDDPEDLPPPPPGVLDSAPPPPPTQA